MKSWALYESPGTYLWGEVELRPPGEHEVVVRVVTSALNHLDLWLAEGQPKPKALPMVPGCDGAGIVSAVGERVTMWQPGDKVVINPSFACGRCSQCLSDRSVHCAQWGIMGEHYWGAHGELVLVGEANLVAKPEGSRWEEAGSYGLCGLTAYRMLRRARLASGETLLVVGAGGGVSSAALLLGRLMGARVFATSRDPVKRARAVELGALDAFGSVGDGTFPVKADVVLDSAGSPTWDRSMRSLRPGGRLVLCGATGGGRVELNLHSLFFGQNEVIGSTMGTFREFAEVTRLPGGLPVVVDQAFDLGDYPAALERLRSGAQFGKIVLRHG